MHNLVVFNAQTITPPQKKKGGEGEEDDIICRLGVRVEVEDWIKEGEKNQLLALMISYFVSASHFIFCVCEK